MIIYRENLEQDSPEGDILWSLFPVTLKIKNFPILKCLKFGSTLNLYFIENEIYFTH